MMKKEQKNTQKVAKNNNCPVMIKWLEALQTRGFNILRDSWNDDFMIRLRHREAFATRELPQYLEAHMTNSEAWTFLRPLPLRLSQLFRPPLSSLFPSGLGSNRVTLMKFLQSLMILELYLKLNYLFKQISNVWVNRIAHRKRNRGCNGLH